MEKLILSPIELTELLDSFRSIVREEMANREQQKSGVKEDRFLTIEQTCELFQPTISRPTLASYTKAGYLQKHLIGNKTFYKLSEVLSAGKTLGRYKKPKG